MLFVFGLRAHVVVLENAGTKVLYTKRCCSSPLYWEVAVFGALVSEEQGEIYDSRKNYHTS
jgi:hypothetical protein